MSAGTPDEAFEALIHYLGRNRGFDFSGYKRPTLMRRVQKRLDALQLADFDDYRDYLEVHADEFEILFNTILINVTSFFRDPQAWDFLRSNVIPSILAAKEGSDENGRSVRIWSAGCASGEEAFSLAIAFAEAMGDTEFRSRVKIYATDIDEESLAQARTGSFSAKAMSDVPDDLVDRYFEPRGTERTFRSDLRRSVIFGRHDLTRDAPISRLDLVVCRNTLMYFNSETQSAIVRRLRFGMNPGGFLFLGRAETLLSYGDLFRAESMPYRVFVNTGESEGIRVPRAEYPNYPSASERDATADLMSGLTIRNLKSPHLLVDADGVTVSINDAARSAFDLAAADLGRPFQDLEISYRPIDLRTPIEIAIAERRVVELSGVERRGSDLRSSFHDIVITPIGQPRQPLLGASISFLDVTGYKAMQAELKRATEELETAYEELQSSNEELETTNEELQSTVEELETTNEELQSTNEELETTNEELRSTNEELEALNGELRVRTDEAQDIQAYLESIVDGVSLGVVVVDDQLIVRTWNVVAEDQWGLRSDEVVGQKFLDIDSGLPVDELRLHLEAFSAGDGPTDDVVVHAINRRGRSVSCRVRFTPLAGSRRPGVVMLLEEVDGDA